MTVAQLVKLLNVVPADTPLVLAMEGRTTDLVEVSIYHMNDEGKSIVRHITLSG